MTKKGWQRQAEKDRADRQELRHTTLVSRRPDPGNPAGYAQVAWMETGPYVITASRGGAFGGAEWFDLDGGEAPSTMPTMEMAIARAVAWRRDARLETYRIHVYRGSRERGTLDPVLELAELK